VRIYRQTYTRPIPDGARITTRSGSVIAQFTGRGGRRTEAKLTKKGDRVLCRSENWYIEFVDHNNVTRRIKVCTEEQPTRELGGKINTWLGYVLMDKTPPAELIEWFTARPVALRNELAKVGVVSRFEDRLVLQDVLQGFQRHLKTEKENSDKHVRSTISQIRRTLEACQYTIWEQIDCQRVHDYLLQLRDGGQGISKRTFNGFVQSMKAFCQWVVDTHEYLDRSPLEKLTRLPKIQTDQRRLRRALETDEAERLIRTTHASSEEREGMTGPERATLYRFILGSGLWVKECRGLRVGDFRFQDTVNPCVLIRAESNLRKGKAELQPISRGLAERMHVYLATRKASLCFGGRFKRLSGHVADALKDDLADAGIDYKDGESYYVDCLSLRETYIFDLVKAGHDIETVRRLARLSSIDRTMRYFRGREKDERFAVETMPALLVQPGRR